MNGDAEIDDLVQSATDALRTMLTRAFEHGRETGKREAAEEIKAQIAGVLGAVETKTRATASPNDLFGIASGEAKAIGVGEAFRAPSGSIRPVLLNALAARPGMRAADIGAATGIKDNTVRGTLRALFQEGEVMKSNGLWFLARRNGAKEAPDATTSGAS